MRVRLLLCGGRGGSRGCEQSVLLSHVHVRMGEYVSTQTLVKCTCIVSIMTLSGVMHSKRLSHTVVCIVGSGCVWRVSHAMCMDREERLL